LEGGSEIESLGVEGHHPSIGLRSLLPHLEAKSSGQAIDENDSDRWQKEVVYGIVG